MLEIEAKVYDRFILEPLWMACFYPRNNSVYSRNKYLLDFIREGDYSHVKDKIETSTSSDLKDPLLLKEILSITISQMQSKQRSDFITYMLSLEPLVYLTKMMPGSVIYRMSEAMVNYRSIIIEAESHDDLEVMNLLIDKFGIELIVSSGVIEESIDNNKSQTIRAILEKDPRFTQEEINTIISMSEDENGINSSLVSTDIGNDRRYSYRNPDDKSKIGKALEMFIALRNQKTSFLSKLSFLPTFTMFAARNLDTTTCLAVAGVAGLTYATYRYRRASL